MKPLSPQEIDLLKAVIKKAGQSILKYYKEKNYNISYKSTANPVTTADLESDQIICGFLREAYPDDALVSEESYTKKNRPTLDRERKNKKRVWYIDPLDGTKEFIAGIPHFTISVGLIIDDQPVFGAIYNPVTKLFCYGGPAYGIFANSKKLGPPKKKKRNFQQLNISLSTSESRQKLFYKIEKSLSEKNITYIGSVACKLALIATGKHDLILSKRSKSYWDIAAGAALLATSGFVFEDKKGNPITFDPEDINVNGLIGGHTNAVDLYKRL